MTIYKTVKTALKHFEERETYKVLHKTEYSYIINNEEFCCAVMNIEWGLFPELPEAMKDNINVARTAIKHNSYLFEFVSNRLKDDEAFIFEAITNCRNETNLRYRAQDINEQYIKAIEKECYFEHCSPRIKKLTENIDDHYEFLKNRLAK